MKKKFKQSTIEKLNYYVYLLEDPRNNKIFYIGKGKGNRIFSHLNGAINGDKESNKIKIINEILNCKLEVKHKIIRHGLTEKEAFEVESALIDIFGLEKLEGNKYLGHYSYERGIMDINEIFINYESEKIIIEDDLIAININNLYYYGINEYEIYESTRKSWRLNLNRAKNIKYALSVFRGIVREVYEINDWYFSKKQNGFNRYEFQGMITKKNIREKYINKDVSEYFSKGSQNPIKYIMINGKNNNK